MTVPAVDKYASAVYTSTFMVFGMVHSDRTVVVLLHKYLVPDLAFYVILSSLS